MLLQSEGTDKLAKALAAFQAASGPASKKGKNPHFRSHYARLEDVWAAARGPLADAGLSVTQWPGLTTEGMVEITTQITHESGQWMRSTMSIPVSKRDAQGVGSAITYGCRYALQAALGMPPSDDDGNEAVKAAPAPRAAKKAKKAKKAPASLKDEIRAARTSGDLKALVGRIKAEASGDELQELRDLYLERLAEVSP